MAALAQAVSFMARDDVAVRMDMEMRNWARVYARWDGPRCVTSAEIIHRQVTPNPDPTPNSERADKVESAVRILKQATGHRRTYWAVLMTRYRSGLINEHAAKRLRMSDRTYRQRMRDAYVWLDGRLSSENS